MSDKRLPFGVGKLSTGWTLLFLASLAVLALGIFAYAQQIIHGEEVTGMRDWGPTGGSPWGLYVAFLVYFSGISFAGITVAALIRLMDIKDLKPVARIAELTTVIAIILCGMSILVDLGQPLRGIVNLFLYARPQSPFFGTFTFVVAGYLFASLVYLYLDGRADAAKCAKTPTKLSGFHRWWAAGYKGTEAEKERHRRASFWLALGIVPLLIAATSTLGFVFGLQVGRPGWFSALQAPAFVALAGVSGLGLLVVLAAIVRSRPEFKGRIPDRTFRSLGLFMLGMALVYLYFMAVELITATYAGHHHEVALTEALISGTYAPIYWSAVAGLVAATVIVASQAITKRWNVPWLVVAGIFVNVAAVLKRYLIVVPSLTHGSLLPYGEGAYAPTWVEYAVVAGIFAFGILLFLVFIKIFPLVGMPAEQDHDEVSAAETVVVDPIAVKAEEGSKPGSVKARINRGGAE